MNNIQRLSIVGATVRAGGTVMEKSASATSGQAQVLNAGWPSPEEGLSKKATLARMLATGEMLEESAAPIEE